MAERQFSMSSTQIAEIMGTVGSPLIVVSELLKNAVDVSATSIDIFYNRDDRTISVENNHKGFTFDEIERLSYPGISTKKRNNNLTNEKGMYLTGSKGLGLLSVFLLCDYAEIYTAPADMNIYKVTLNKNNGSVELTLTEEKADYQFTKVILKDVSIEIIDFLSSESEVRKLRHISTYLFKNAEVPFPTIRLHIFGQSPQEVNFSCCFPAMLYDVAFNYKKDEQVLNFRCISPSKAIYEDVVTFDKFDLESLQLVMLNKYGIKDTIATRTNEQTLTAFDAVPSFEGRFLVYEKNLAGAQLKTYGAGVNIYVNDFALYNYLAEENDWLGLADYSQRKKVTRLKPHNVFGFVNFPSFDENKESLKISNERADFIQDLTFSKLMYLLKGVVMFAIFNIDVADKNPKYKEEPQRATTTDNDSNALDAPPLDEERSSINVERSDNSNSGEYHDNYSDGHTKDKNSNHNDEPYSPSYSPYKPKQLPQKSLLFTQAEGAVIESLRGKNDLCNKICNLVFELSRLDLQIHRHSIAYLYRALLESSTKYLSTTQSKVLFEGDSLEKSIVSALNYFGNVIKQNKQLSIKTIRTWRDTITQRKIIDTLNQYIHNEQPVDALLLQETWNTLKSYIMACITIR